MFERPSAHTSRSRRSLQQRFLQTSPGLDRLLDVRSGAVLVDLSPFVGSQHPLVQALPSIECGTMIRMIVIPASPACRKARILHHLAGKCRDIATHWDRSTGLGKKLQYLPPCLYPRFRICGSAPGPSSSFWSTWTKSSKPRVVGASCANVQIACLPMGRLQKALQRL